jgi:hypothetical protein
LAHRESRFHDRRGRCRPEQQRYDRQIAEDRLQERKLDLDRMLGRVRRIVGRNERIRASTMAMSIGTSPSGVAKAVSDGAAMPRNGTKCAGPMTAARAIRPRRPRTPAKASAATGPE